MNVDYDITFKFTDSIELFRGRCTSISCSGLAFVTDRQIDQGKALEITVEPNNTVTPTMNAFIEVLRNTRQADDSYVIAATIKSIKGN